MRRRPSPSHGEGQSSRPPGVRRAGTRRPAWGGPRPSGSLSWAARDALKAARDRMVFGAPKREARSMAPRRGACRVRRGGGPIPSRFAPLARALARGAPEPPRAAPQPGTAPPAHTASLGPERAARSITRAHARPVHGRASAPPVIAIPTPVVLGKVIGSFLRLRTARYANACASRYADDQP